MSESQLVIQEKQQIDHLLQSDYRIFSIEENLSGSFVCFEKEGLEHTVKDKEILLIKTAEARKYFSTILFYQRV